MMFTDIPNTPETANDYAIIRVRHKKSGAMAWRVFHD